jgi:hypothetical protein
MKRPGVKVEPEMGQKLGIRSHEGGGVPTCRFVSPLPGEGRGFEPLSAHPTTLVAKSWPKT